MPRDYEEMEFSIEEERWNEYELNDGARIRGRVILQKIVRDPNNPNRFSFKFGNVMWVVFAPAHMRGEPSPNPQDLANAQRYQVHINNSNELWNVYRVIRTGQVLRIKLEVVNVSRYTDRYDADGMPIYNVENGVAINMSPAQPTQGQ
jgi:hypothetical protein